MIELSVVVPTFNERENIPHVLAVLERDLAGIEWEVIFVDDDSPDGTAASILPLAQKNPAVRVLHRIGRRGLSSASIEGMMASAAPFIAVMDADLQHDSRLLRPMLEILRAEPADMVCGSRYMDRGGFGEWSGARQRMSRLATWVSKTLLKVELSDPMSGFFMLRREYLDRAVRNLSAQGFKIFLDLVTATKGQAVVRELPYEFGARLRGESKLDSLVILEFGLLLIERRLPGIPLRFLEFIFVGLLGALGHLAVLLVLLRIPGCSFMQAQTGATFFAMTVNFVLNNLFTYRQNKLVGARFLQGLLSFYVACSLGALASITIAQYLYAAGIPWWLSGVLGAVVAGVWNFAVTSTVIWRPRGGK